MSGMVATCPHCGSADVLTILWGLPAGPAGPDERVAYGGCILGPDDAAHECASCGRRFGRRDDEPESAGYVVALDHVQLAMPAGGEAHAIAFYERLLGLPLVAKPPRLAERGGCWFERGDLKVHLGVDPAFRPATKAHPAFVVDDLAALAAALAEAGHRVVDEDPLDGYDRVYVDDPFGNRIELLEPFAERSGSDANAETPDSNGT